MIEVMLSMLFNLYLFPSGRRSFAINKCLEEAQTLNVPNLITRLEAAAAHERKTLNAEIARNNARKASAQHSTEAKALDGKVDTLISALHDGLHLEIRAFGADSEKKRVRHF